MKPNQPLFASIKAILSGCIFEYGDKKVTATKGCQIDSFWR